MKNFVGLGFTFCTVHRFAGLIHGRSLLSRILGLLLVWEGAVLGLLISLPKQGWKINRRSTAIKKKGLGAVIMAPVLFAHEYLLAKKSGYQKPDL